MADNDLKKKLKNYIKQCQKTQQIQEHFMPNPDPDPPGVVRMAIFTSGHNGYNLAQTGGMYLTQEGSVGQSPTIEAYYQKPNPLQYGGQPPLRKMAVATSGHQGYQLKTTTQPNYQFGGYDQSSEQDQPTGYDQTVGASLHECFKSQITPDQLLCKK